MAAFSSVAVAPGAAAASLAVYTEYSSGASPDLSFPADQATLALSAAHGIVSDAFVRYVLISGQQAGAQAAAATRAMTVAGAGARAAAARVAAARAAAVRAALARAAAVQQRALARQAAAREAAARQALAQSATSQGSASQATATPPPAANLTSVATPAGSPQQIALALLAGYGWAGQFSCLNSLWMRESGWNVYAKNPSSGAYGIPQALPASKMASAGPDWLGSAATQIRWGLGYIRSVYGSPCGAWGHEEAVGWY